MSVARAPYEWQITRNPASNLIVTGLAEQGGHVDDSLLIYFYLGGDVDLVTENGEKLHKALYDLYQCHDDLHEGDTFALDGKVLYRCEGVHVLQVSQ